MNKPLLLNLLSAPALAGFVLLLSSCQSPNRCCDIDCRTSSEVSPKTEGLIYSKSENLDLCACKLTSGLISFSGAVYGVSPATNELSANSGSTPMALIWTSIPDRYTTTFSFNDSPDKDALYKSAQLSLVNNAHTFCPSCGICVAYIFFYASEAEEVVSFDFHQEVDQLYISRYVPGIRPTYVRNEEKGGAFTLIESSDKLFKKIVSLVAVRNGSETGTTPVLPVNPNDPG